MLVTPQIIYRPGQIVVHHGRIIECTDRCSGRADLELPGKLLAPALINAHTHLEFSDLKNPLAAGDSFPQWIRAVVERRRVMTAQTANDADFQRLRATNIRLGLDEAWRTGTALTADIVTRPWLPSYLATLNAPIDSDNYNNPNSVIFHADTPPAEIAKHLASGPEVIALAEILGLDESRFDESANWALQLVSDIESLQSYAPEGQLNGELRLRTGLSPHSPYSLNFNKLLSVLAANSREQQLTAMHVAESLEEREWLEQGTGPFRSAFELLGVSLTAPRPSILEVIEWLATRSRSLLIHGNYLKEHEIERIARTPAMSIVYCPRTHQHFGHASYPLKRLLDAGIQVVLATDSRASTPDLSLWSEVNAARAAHPWLSPEWLFEAVTTAAAKALGVERDYGSLLPGSRAAINVCDCLTETKTVDMVDELTTRINPFQPLIAILGKSSASRRDAAT